MIKSAIIIESKNNCCYVYYDGKIIKNNIPAEITHVWKFSDKLAGINFVQLWCGGKTLDEICPSQEKENWKYYSSRVKAFFNSFIEAKVNLSEHCVWDTIPEKTLLGFCRSKHTILNHAIKEYKSPDNYAFLAGTYKMLEGISKQKLNLDLKVLKERVNDDRAHMLYKSIKNKDKINYNLFGTKTGRLTTKPNSFPVLNFDKKYRSVLKPHNDFFVELDYDAAEVRVMRALLGLEPIYQDLHSYHAKNIWNGKVLREEAKSKYFEWVYNPDSENELLEKIYPREKILNKFWNGKEVYTIFNRKIKSDRWHALNYVLQSTLNDLVLQQAMKAKYLLKDRKSLLTGVVHDSILIDVAKEDVGHIKNIRTIFSNTYLGKFKVNFRYGYDFGNMKNKK